MEMLSLARDVGLPIALVLFFVWQGKIREDRLTLRICTLEEYVRSTLEAIVRDNTMTVKRNTVVMTRLETRLDDDHDEHQRQ